MKFTLTSTHVDRAIVQKQRLGLHCDICPVAQVLMERFPDRRVKVLGEEIYINRAILRTTPNMRKVIGLFDDKQYSQLRSLLPISFILPDL